MSPTDPAATARRLAELEAKVQRLRRDVEDLAGLSTDPGAAPTHPAAATRDAGRPGEAATSAPGSAPTTDPSPPAPGGGPSDPVFTAADDWVGSYLLPTFQRSFGGELRWCLQWQTHPEAVVRLEAMWRAWEMLTPDEGLGLSVWLLSHFDPSFSVLTSRHGPFARCTPDRHSA